MHRKALRFWAPWLVGLASLVPLGLLVWRAFAGHLGVNPIETIIDELGVWALRLFVGALAITPAARLLRMPALVRLRRPIGLAAFGYVLLHLSAYIGVDQFFDWNGILKDIIKRPYITFGMLGFVLAAPLAITSTNAMLRRLAPPAWRALHRLAYVVPALGVLHYYLLVKADHRPPLAYAAILALLLAWRVIAYARQRLRARPRAVSLS
jgi:sulfoxide reductase heme-binding subunit YedZ